MGKWGGWVFSIDIKRRRTDTQIRVKVKDKDQFLVKLFNMYSEGFNILFSFFAIKEKNRLFYFQSFFFFFKKIFQRMGPFNYDHSLS